MRRKWSALAAALLVAACGASPTGTSSVAGTSGGPFTLTDALGRTVAFDAPPARVVVAGKAAFLVADAVYMFPEAVDRVVALPKATQGGRDFISVIDPRYGAKTILDGNAGADQVAASNPDVVILKSSSASSLGKPLIEVGIKVVYVDFETPEQYTRDLAILGSLFGDQPRAAELKDYFRGQVERVREAVAGYAGDVAATSTSRAPSVLLVNYSSKNGSAAFQVPPAGYIQSLVVDMAGGRRVWDGAQLGNGWTTVSLEQIAAWNPDQIYVVAYFDRAGDVAARLSTDGQWQSLAAVRAGAVYGFPCDFYSWDEPDPRWLLGLTWLATHVNPAAAQRLNVSAEVRSFYATAYGLAGSRFDSLVGPYLPAGLN